MNVQLNGKGIDVKDAKITVPTLSVKMEAFVALYLPATNVYALTRTILGNAVKSKERGWFFYKYLPHPSPMFRS